MNGVYGTENSGTPPKKRQKKKKRGAEKERTTAKIQELCKHILVSEKDSVQYSSYYRIAIIFKDKK